MLNKIEALHNFLADAPPQGAAWRAGIWGLSGSPMAEKHRIT